jgi:hypothetical protein
MEGQEELWKRRLGTGTGFACAKLSEILPSARVARFVRMTEERLGGAGWTGNERTLPSKIASAEVKEKTKLAQTNEE